MAKKKSWLDRVKRLFVSENKKNLEKNERRKIWLLGWLKSKSSPALPAPSHLRAKSLREAEDEQSKHALAVAVATAAAAEAAVAAAQAAAQVVRLTGTPPSYQLSREIAAMQIQTAFRGYLARRALRALKGLVRLQALVRGQAVRRQTTVTLKGLQSLMKIQSQTRANRLRNAEDYQSSDGKDIVHRRTKSGDVKRTQNNERRWDGSTLSKEEISAILKSRREAALKRECALGYASSHQERRNAQRPTAPIAKEHETDDPSHKWSWLEQWVGTHPLDKDIPEIHPVTCQDQSLRKQQPHVSDSLIGLDSGHKEKAEESQLRYLARRSINRSTRNLVRDDDSFSSSPSFPSYMALTASSKARFRSMSTPKQRVGVRDIYADHCITYTSRLHSPIPSIVSDAGLSKTRPPIFHQRSPHLNGQTGPGRPLRSPNHLSLDSECSPLHWDQPQFL